MPKKIESKKHTIDDMILAVQGKFGKESIMRYSANALFPVPVVSSGSIAINKALGIGGYPRGRIVEIYGPESGGKTSLALHAIASAQKEGSKCAIIDVENAFDPRYAKNLGVVMEELMISQPDSGEDALGIVDMLLDIGNVGVIAIDSVAALVPRAELEGEMSDGHMGLQARLMGKALRKITKKIRTTQTVVIFINQLREKMNVMFGSPETTPGGRALKFFSSVRLDVRRTSTQKDKEGNPISNNIKVRIVKNKMAPPGKVAETNILYGYGIDKYEELLNECLDKRVIVKKGAWFSYDDVNIGQGRAGVIQKFKDDDKFYSDLLEYVLCDEKVLIDLDPIKSLKKHLKTLEKGSVEYRSVKTKIKELKSKE